MYIDRLDRNRQTAYQFMYSMLNRRSVKQFKNVSCLRSFRVRGECATTSPCDFDISPT